MMYIPARHIYPNAEQLGDFLALAVWHSKHYGGGGYSVIGVYFFRGLRTYCGVKQV